MKCSGLHLRGLETVRTIVLGRISKRVKEVVDKIRLVVVVLLSRSFWTDVHNDMVDEKLKFVMRQLVVVTGWCRITTLELSPC